MHGNDLQNYKNISTFLLFESENEYFCNILFDMSRFCIYILSFLTILPHVLYAQTMQLPKYEYRAVWLTTIENLDWPATLVKTPSDIPVQKQELIDILDSLHSLNINTVLLQTRLRGDVIYPSEIEPFSKVLTGVPGRNPGYDPLAFAIEECHKRGIQLHAWLVTLPLGKVRHVRAMGRYALKNKHPELCRVYNGNWSMEPAEQGTADYLSELVTEIVTKYNIDGIHLDYIRYPDSPKGYPDRYLHRRYGNGRSLDDWRRDNITRIVSKVYNTVKQHKPWVRVSCAPLGKYDDLSSYSSLGYNARNTVFQDAQKWLRDGIVDILFPMIYFSDNNFYPFVRDWQENSSGRHIVPGMAPYRLLPEYGDWETSELKRQLVTSRNAGTIGSVMFRTRHILDNVKGFTNIYSRLHNRKALVPPLSWCTDETPLPPLNIHGQREGDTLVLRWSKVAQPDSIPSLRYNVYMSLDTVGDITDTGNLMATMLSDSIYKWGGSSLSTVRWAVTSVDAFGVESAPSCWNEPGCVLKLYSEEFELSEPPTWGMQIVLRDAVGTELYKGAYRRRIGVRGFPPGVYRLEVLSREGSLLERYTFTR